MSMGQSSRERGDDAEGGDIGILGTHCNTLYYARLDDVIHKLIWLQDEVKLHADSHYSPCMRGCVL